MLVALGSLAVAKPKAPKQLSNCTQLLNYAATHPDAILHFQASDMILHIHSDASYLSESKARSHAGGFFFLSNNTKNPPSNGAIHIHSSIMQSILASATAAEVGSLFYIAQDGAMLHTTLAELGHPQPAMLIQTDNAVADGIINKCVKQ